MRRREICLCYDYELGEFMDKIPERFQSGVHGTNFDFHVHRGRGSRNDYYINFFW